MKKNIISPLLRNRIFRVVFVAALIVGGIVIYQNWPDGTCRNCNVILISVDTLRADHMGVYGYSKDTTPNIDRWAKEATVFTNAYTIVPLTFHSFYTLMTGKKDAFEKNSMGVSYINVDNQKTNIATLAKILKTNNFYTVAFVSNPVVGELNEFFADGFDFFKFFDITNSSDYFSREIFKHEYENAKSITYSAKKWLTNKPKNNFYLWLHYNVTHGPYNPQLKYLCLIDKNCKDPKYIRLIEQSSNLSGCNNLPKDKEDLIKLQNLYDAEILSTDEQIGEILSTLKKNNLFNNTIVIFYGDHGEGFDHNISNHGYSLYNSEIHIPLIIYYPHAYHKKNVTQIIDNSDILPTLLSLLKINYAQYVLKGEDLSTTLKSNKQAGNPLTKYIYSRTPINYSASYSIINGSFKYIYTTPENRCNQDQPNEELYNLKLDPNEKNNIINSNNLIKQKLKKILTEKIGEKTEDNSNLDDKKNVEKLKSLGY